MSYSITLVYPDADATDAAELYLPGEPVFSAQGESCGICGENIDRFEDLDGATHYGDVSIGDHRGVILAVEERPGFSEPLHLRCVMDTGEEFRSIGIITSAAELPGEGRHLKSA
jgi:hypothetical protein